MILPLFIKRDATLVLFLIVIYAAIHAVATIALFELAPDEGVTSGLMALLAPPWWVIMQAGDLVGYDAEELLAWPAFIGAATSLLYTAIGFLFARTCAVVAGNAEHHFPPACIASEMNRS
jgi:hypothetical protein